MFVPVTPLLVSPDPDGVPPAPGATIAPPPPRHREAAQPHRGPPDRGRDFNRSSRHRGQWNKKNG